MRRMKGLPTPMLRSTTVCCSATGFMRRRAGTPALDSAPHGNNIPAAVVENLVSQAKAGTAPLHRYHRLRKQALGLTEYHTYDSAIPLVEFDQKHPYDEGAGLVAAVGRTARRRLSAPNARGAGEPLYRRMRTRASGASALAPVYGCAPFMLLNYNDTLDAVFTLAHEFGHSMMHGGCSRTRISRSYTRTTPSLSRKCRRR